jgi:anti-anti-sigma regulatory factor
MVIALPRTVDQASRATALAELERLMTQALAPAGNELTVGSTLRGDYHTVVMIGGSVDERAIRLLAAHFAGLLNAGARHLVVDLSRVDAVPDSLLDLMRRVEARVLALNGVFELTGLRPPVLYAMDDVALAEVFAQYRVLLDDARPRALRWSDLLCPQGLDDVPEPGSAARCRCFIDTAAHGRGERWGRRR